MKTLVHFIRHPHFINLLCPAPHERKVSKDPEYPERESLSLGEFAKSVIRQFSGKVVCCETCNEGSETPIPTTIGRALTNRNGILRQVTTLNHTDARALALPFGMNLNLPDQLKDKFQLFVAHCPDVLISILNCIVWKHTSPGICPAHRIRDHKNRYPYSDFGIREC